VATEIPLAQEGRQCHRAPDPANGIRNQRREGPRRGRRTSPTHGGGRRGRRCAPLGQHARPLEQRRSGGAAAEDRKSYNGAVAPRRRAGGSTPSLPPPPPPARGGAPPRRGRCGPRLSPTPGGKRASRSTRRRRRSASRTTARPPPVGVTAPADDDGGRRRRASRVVGKTAADWAVLDPAAPPQRAKNLATAPPRPSAAPAEAPRHCRRRRRPPGAVRPHAEGVAVPDFPLRQAGKRASQSLRRRRRSTNRTTGIPPPVGVTAPADHDGGRRRRAARTGREGVAYFLRARSCAAGTPARPSCDLVAVDSRPPSQQRTPLASPTRRIPAIGSAARHQSAFAPVRLSGSFPGGGQRLRWRPPSPTTSWTASSTPLLATSATATPGGRGTAGPPSPRTYERHEDGTAADAGAGHRCRLFTTRDGP